MADNLIKGGYILLSKRIIDSEIFKKPPLYLKIWIYLLSRAQWKDYKDLKRGQLWTSIPEIQESCSYYIGYRKETPTIKQIRDVLDWLRSSYEGDTKGAMIGTTRGTHGLLVTICNYSVYQDVKNYEGHNESNDEAPTKGEVGALYKERTNKEDNKDSICFDAFWKSYPRKIAKAAAKKSFDKLKADGQLLNTMLSAIERQKQSKQWQEITFIPYASTWLNNRRWEDEAEEQAETILVQTGINSFKF